jgi:hypothetical protein
MKWGVGVGRYIRTSVEARTLNAAKSAVMRRANSSAGRCGWGTLRLWDGPEVVALRPLLDVDAAGKPVWGAWENVPPRQTWEARFVPDGDRLVCLYPGKTVANLLEVPMWDGLEEGMYGCAIPESRRTWATKILRAHGIYVTFY